MEKKLQTILEQVIAAGRFEQEHQYRQHGVTTLFEHSVNVASESIRLARLLHLKTDEESLIRGALLHDYYLYDWHDSTSAPPLHGIQHPYIALENAKQDFLLTEIEQDIIVHHMFPLTLLPPMHREAWIVCAADKYCALCETFAPIVHRKEKSEVSHAG